MNEGQTDNGEETPNNQNAGAGFKSLNIFEAVEEIVRRHFTKESRVEYARSRFLHARAKAREAAEIYRRCREDYENARRESRAGQTSDGETFEGGTNYASAKTDGHGFYKTTAGQLAAETN